MNFSTSELNIHPTAILGDKCFIDKGTCIGCFTVIGSNVQIGQNVKIGNHVVIHQDSVIEDNVRIDDHAVIGKLPMRAAASTLSISGSLPACTIGAHCIIGTSAILYRGASIGSASLVADLATVRENVIIGDHTIIGRGAAVENNCTIGCRCKLETNSYITAFSSLGNDVFVAPGVVTSNDRHAARLNGKEYIFKGVTIKDGGRVGAQATILPEITIFEEGFAAAGSVVTKDIPKAAIYCGNPARYMKPVPEEQLLKK